MNPEMMELVICKGQRGNYVWSAGASPQGDEIMILVSLEITQMLLAPQRDLPYIGGKRTRENDICLWMLFECDWC